MEEREVRVSAGPVELEGNLGIPEVAQGIYRAAGRQALGRHRVAGAAPEHARPPGRLLRREHGAGPHWSRQRNTPRRWARSSHEADGRLWRGRSSAVCGYVGLAGLRDCCRGTMITKEDRYGRQDALSVDSARRERG